MAKDKTEDQPEVFDPYVGGEDDDLMDMEYPQDEETISEDTHPPATKEEAELRAEEEALRAKAEEEAKEEPKAEEEPEEEPKAEEEPEPEPEADDDSEKDRKIPYDRFEEVNNKRKEAEEEAARLKAQIEKLTEEATPEPEPEPYDYATKEQEAADALLEGDNQKYAEIRAEIRAVEREETLREAQRIASEGDRNLQETMTFEEVGDSIEQNFPQFNIKNEAYNEAAREEMLDLYVGYAKSGLYSRTQALQRAADKTVKMYGFDEKETPETEDTPDNVVTMTPPDVKKKAKAANQQPPAMKSKAPGSEEEPRVDPRSMSDEEFEALPESTKRRMRGDVV